MANTDIRLGDIIIYGADDITRSFVNEFLNDKDYVTAHTSGSTGSPKEIKLLKNDMIVSAKATCQYFGINSESRLLLPLSASYIAGKMMVVRAIVSGADLYVEKPSNTPFNKDYGKIDLLPIVPSQIEAILSSQYLPQIQNVIIGGGAVPHTIEEKIVKSGINAYATYGMTETCSHIALRKINGNSSCYHALPGITFATDDRQCLIINAPKYSFESIITNDVVKIIDENKFQWIGRYDNVINTGGIKVYPEDIEKKISHLIDVPFYIAGVGDEKWGTKVVLYIEALEYNKSLILNEASCILDKFSLPKEIRLIANFERTDSGKIKRLPL